MKMTSLQKISSAVESHLNSTVAQTVFKGANDNKAHYEALCCKIQENERRAAFAQSKPKTDADPEYGADGPSVEAKQDDPDVAEAATKADPAETQRTERALQQIYSYIIEQSFEAKRAQEFLHYMMEQQAMQFAMQPLPGDSSTPEANAQPQLNFVAIQQMHENIPHLLSPQMQHSHHALFAQNSMDMSQPGNAAAMAPTQKNNQKAAQQRPDAPSYGKIEPHIERELQAIAQGSQFNPETVKAATVQLQFAQTSSATPSQPDEESYTQSQGQAQPPQQIQGAAPTSAGTAAPTGGDNNDMAVSLIKDAMKENALAEEAKLKNKSEIYVAERRVQVVYVHGGKEEITHDSGTVKTEAQRSIQHTADSHDKNVSVTRQFHEFTNIDANVKMSVDHKTEEQAKLIQEDSNVASTYVLNRQGVLISKPIATGASGKQAVGRLGENSEEMIGNSTKLALQEPLKKLGNVPGFTMNIAS